MSLGAFTTDRIVMEPTKGARQYRMLINATTPFGGCCRQPFLSYFDHLSLKRQVCVEHQIQTSIKICIFFLIGTRAKPSHTWWVACSQPATFSCLLGQGDVGMQGGETWSETFPIQFSMSQTNRSFVSPLFGIGGSKGGSYPNCTMHMLDFTCTIDFSGCNVANKEQGLSPRNRGVLRKKHVSNIWWNGYGLEIQSISK